MGYKQDKKRREVRDKQVMKHGYSRALRDMLIIIRNQKNDISKKGFFETERERKVLSDLYNMIMKSLMADDSMQSIIKKIERRNWK